MAFEAIADFLNEDGSLQFSAATHSFTFVGKGSIEVTDHWTGTPYAIGSNKVGTYGSTVVGYDFDIVCFRCTDAFFLPANRPYDGEDPRTIRVFTQEGYPGFSGIYRYPLDYKTGLSSHIVDYWCFRSLRHYAPPEAVCGIQLLNEDGTLCYDNSFPLAQVVHHKQTFADASTAAPGTPEALANPATTALMKYGTTALAAVSGVSPSYRTVWYNEAVKNTATGYSRKHFSAFFQHRSLVTGTSLGTSIGGGGIIGIDISPF